MTNATLARAWFLAVALYRSLGEFVSSLISIAEEIVRASFRGTVLALNRSLHGLTGPRRDGKVGRSRFETQRQSWARRVQLSEPPVATWCFIACAHEASSSSSMPSAERR